MQNTPDGVVSERSPDGVGAPSGTGVSDKLRSLADWLDAHPSAVMHQVSFIDTDATGMARAHSFGAGSREEMDRQALVLGGVWKAGETDTAFTLERVIVPGIVFEFFASRALIEDVAA